MPGSARARQPDQAQHVAVGVEAIVRGERLAALAVSLTDHSRPGLLAWVGVAYAVLAIVLGPFVAGGAASGADVDVRPGATTPELLLAGEVP